MIGKKGKLIVYENEKNVGDGCMKCVFKCGNEEKKIYCKIK